MLAHLKKFYLKGSLTAFEILQKDMRSSFGQENWASWWNAEFYITFLNCPGRISQTGIEYTGIEIEKDIQIQINDRWAGKTYISQVSSDLSETTTNLWECIACQFFHRGNMIVDTKCCHLNTKYCRVFQSTHSKGQLGNVTKCDHFLKKVSWGPASVTNCDHFLIFWRRSVRHHASVSKCDQPLKKVGWGPGIASLEKKKNKIAKIVIEQQYRYI